MAVTGTTVSVKVLGLTLTQREKPVAGHGRASAVARWHRLLGVDWTAASHASYVGLAGWFGL